MQGFYAVYRKELQDQLSSYRFVILFALIAMVSFVTSYMAGVHMRENLEALAANYRVFQAACSSPGQTLGGVVKANAYGTGAGLVLVQSDDDLADRVLLDELLGGMHGQGDRLPPVVRIEEADVRVLAVVGDLLQEGQPAEHLEFALDRAEGRLRDAPVVDHLLQIGVGFFL